MSRDPDSEIFRHRLNKIIQVILAIPKHDKKNKEETTKNDKIGGPALYKDDVVNKQHIEARQALVFKMCPKLSALMEKAHTKECINDLQAKKIKDELLHYKMKILSAINKQEASLKKSSISLIEIAESYPMFLVKRIKATDCATVSLPCESQRAAIEVISACKILLDLTDWISTQCESLQPVDSKLESAYEEMKKIQVKVHCLLLTTKSIDQKTLQQINNSGNE